MPPPLGTQCSAPGRSTAVSATARRYPVPAAVKQGRLPCLQLGLGSPGSIGSNQGTPDPVKARGRIDAVLIAAGRLVTGDEVVTNGWIETAGAEISALGAGTPPRQPDVALPGVWVVPGFVDMHTHGGGGASVTQADAAAVHTFVDAHLRHGTTTTLASLVSADYDSLEADVRLLAELTTQGVIAGVHLEGPWLSPGRCGAHDPTVLQRPTPEAINLLVDAGKGTVRMVTLAPELQHGLEAIRLLTARGVIAAIGHTDATYEVTRAAIDSGATVATHLFNGMAPFHHRHPGPAPALLEDNRVTVELIYDGIHLHPAAARLAYAAAGSDRVALITDAMAAAAAGDGAYRLGDREVRVQHGVARLVDGGAIAGSTLTMDRAFRWAVLQCGISILDAVHAASVNPARVLGLKHVGTLRSGMQADLVVLTKELQVRAVMARGSWVVQP
jgi:N-acetylglucosamine-6-phosphate deacetylase